MNIDNNYWVSVYKDNMSGIFCARKIYDNNSSGIPYMWGSCAESVVEKLIEDGEDENNIRVEEN